MATLKIAVVGPSKCEGRPLRHTLLSSIHDTACMQVWQNNAVSCSLRAASIKGIYTNYGGQVGQIVAALEHLHHTLSGLLQGARAAAATWQRASGCSTLGLRWRPGLPAVLANSCQGKCMCAEEPCLSVTHGSQASSPLCTHQLSA